LKRVTIVGETAESVETPAVVHAADQFVVAFPEREDEPPAPKLGIGFDEQPGREGVVVKSVLPGGSAANAGVAVGDVLSSLGGATLFDLTDVRYLVDAAKVGDVLTCCGLRDGAPISFTITLVPSPPPAPEAAPRP
jgi:S1-C subfamily serine protease